MPSPYEDHLIKTYALNALTALDEKDPAVSRIVKYFRPQGLDVNYAKSSNQRRNTRVLADVNDRNDGKQIPSDAATLKKKLFEDCSVKKIPFDTTATRLKSLRKTIGLDKKELEILELLLRIETSKAIESLVKGIFRRNARSDSYLKLYSPMVGLLLGRNQLAVNKRLRIGSQLVGTGLVRSFGDGSLEIGRRLLRLATVGSGAKDDAASILLDVANPSDLKWKDFDHIAGDRDHIEGLIRGALKRDALGVNILIYGPPGTGKTEFCKVLAERLGNTLYCIGEDDEDGDEPARYERLEDLRLTQRLLANSANSLLLFDEMDDLFEVASPFNFRSRRGTMNPTSKVFMHRTLERTPVPTLWTMNDAKWVNPAILRRMMFALELRPPTNQIKSKVWRRQLDRHGIVATSEDVRQLSADFDTTPGVVAGTTTAAGLSGGGIDAVFRGVRSVSRLLGRERPPESKAGLFLPELIQADVDPLVLAESVARAGEMRFSMVLQGPPGTGKSAYVRYVAERLGMEVMQNRTSDLVSMWVGETERQIAQAFAEARRRRSILVFDEADSLLSDRRFANRNWEVNQLNEMLTWMESHPLPFACTTNFGERLDPATLRRFVFKVNLGYMSHEQVEMAFQSYFALSPPASLKDLNALTPGDFAVVRRKGEILGCLKDADVLTEMLKAECDAKPNRPQAIGFRS